MDDRKMRSWVAATPGGRLSELYTASIIGSNDMRTLGRRIEVLHVFLVGAKQISPAKHSQNTCIP